MTVGPIKVAMPAIRRARELRTISLMVRMFCRAHHAPEEVMCSSCQQLLDYAQRRLARCPFGEAKPACNSCKIHCYSANRRNAVREVMRWAGPRMLWRHPLLAIRHLQDSRRPTPSLDEINKNIKK